MHLENIVLDTVGVFEIKDRGEFSLWHQGIHYSFSDIHSFQLRCDFDINVKCVTGGRFRKIIPTAYSILTSIWQALEKSNHVRTLFFLYVSDK